VRDVGPLTNDSGNGRSRLNRGLLVAAIRGDIFMKKRPPTMPKTRTRANHGRKFLTVNSGVRAGSVLVTNESLGRP
jgi:hypothetical protein